MSQHSSSDVATLPIRCHDSELGISLLLADVVTFLVQCCDISLMSLHSSAAVVNLSVMSQHSSVAVVTLSAMLRHSSADVTTLDFFAFFAFFFLLFH